jgi:VIT1/CCC1 family predicted Fe2+/Mn2+ transporter
MKTAHVDATAKGALLGLLTYAGAKYDLSAEVIAACVPVAALVLSFVSTKIGDKNTTMLIDLATKAVAAAPAKPAVKKTPAKKK